MMKGGIFALGVAVFSLLVWGSSSFCQDSSSSRHLIIRFDDPGPPAIHSVQAKTSDNPNGVWSMIPANISLSEDGFHCKATLEVPDVRWGMFRVNRQGSDDSGPLSVQEVKTAPANGPVFGVDVAYANAVTNDQLWGQPRFLLVGPFWPGKVLVGFQDYVTEQEAIAFFNAGGLRFEPHFPRIFGGVWCRVASGDPWEHVTRLEEHSDIVMWADWRGSDDSGSPMIIVAFNKWATVESVTELLSSMEGLEPDWDSMNPFGGPKYGRVYVPEGHELAWVLVLEQHPMITYAQTSGIVSVQ